MFGIITNWFKRMKQESYTDELKKAVKKEIAFKAEEAFNKLAVTHNCESFKVLSDGSVEFYFPANTKTPHRHKVVVFPSQLVYV